MPPFTKIIMFMHSSLVQERQLAGAGADRDDGAKRTIRFLAAAVELSRSSRSLVSPLEFVYGRRAAQRRYSRPGHPGAADDVGAGPRVAWPSAFQTRRARRPGPGRAGTRRTDRCGPGPAGRSPGGTPGRSGDGQLGAPAQALDPVARAERDGAQDGLGSGRICSGARPTVVRSRLELGTALVIDQVGHVLGQHELPAVRGRHRAGGPSACSSWSSRAGGLSSAGD